jgi:mannosyltransferase OCH1-like enzyme
MSSEKWPHYSFDEAMHKEYFPDVYGITEKIVGVDGQQLYDFFKNLYDSKADIAVAEAVKIPKIIHQIWLGSPVPEVFKALQQSWITHHLGRDWYYKLWTDDDIAQLGLYNQHFYDETDNYGVKSDIARWEIIYRFGGVYVDMDFECLRSLDILHYTYDFYTALQPLDTSFVQLGAALFGSCPGHPLLKHCIETIKDDWHHKGAPKKTGPVHFTRSFYAMAGKNGMNDIAFPAFYFYPLGCRSSSDNRNEWKNAGAFAVHWWAKSWMPQDYRPQQFKSISNEMSVYNWNS